MTIQHPNRKETKVNGHNIKYLDYRNPDRRSDDTVILLHGIGGSSEVWSLAAPSISRFFRVVVPDIIGFGGSDKPTVEYTLDFFLKFFEGFVSNLQVEKVDIIGTTFGNYLATEFAIRFAKRTNKLVLCAPPHYNKESNPAVDGLIMSGLYPKYENVIEAFTKIAFADNTYDYMDLDAAKLIENSVKNFMKNMRKGKNGKYALMSTLIGIRYAKPNPLSRISCPTLIIWGEKDSVVPVKYADRFKEIPNSNLMILKECGHNPFIQRPVEFNKVVLKFLISPERSI